eukprot:SAG31_NODE_33146_length_347_cov_0.826613_1_plen_31_part_10
MSATHCVTGSATLPPLSSRRPQAIPIVAGAG